MVTDRATKWLKGNGKAGPARQTPVDEEATGHSVPSPHPGPAAHGIPAAR